jgi:hypothetical protein
MRFFSAREKEHWPVSCFLLGGENQAKVRWSEFAQIPKKLNSLRRREKAGSAMKEAFSGQHSAGQPKRSHQQSALSGQSKRSHQRSAISQSQNKQQNQKRFTTEMA